MSYWDININEICIPDYVAETILVPYIENGYYKNRNVKENDTVIVIRPPSLSASSVQPMKVKIWKRTCLGFCPENCKEYHADFDGDELQLYFVTERKSIVECSKWELLTERGFDYTKIHKEIPSVSYNSVKELRKNFMLHTTMSFRQLLKVKDFNYTEKSVKYV